VSPRHAAVLVAVTLAAADVAPTVGAQHQAVHEIPRIPQALLERPTSLRSGVGAVHDDVAAASPDAQRFFDQGLAYIHSYVWIEAARSLNQAIRLDAELAAAHAALSLVYVETNKPEESRAALATAQRLAAGESSHERRHVSIRAAQAAAEQAPADGSKLAAYRAALAQAVADFPRDVEFALLQGLATSPDPFERGQGTGAEAVPYFEQARRLAPDHPGARHYLTHALENAGRVDHALTEAREYVRLAPEVPHAHHMLGHDLRRAGRVADAEKPFLSGEMHDEEVFVKDGCRRGERRAQPRSSRLRPDRDAPGQDGLQGCQPDVPGAGLSRRSGEIRRGHRPLPRKRPRLHGPRSDSGLLLPGQQLR
jgi:tetratricopeptide (TPR) repeat protein